MNIGITPISKENFNNNVKIRFKNILDGFNNYNYRSLTAKDITNFKFNEDAFIKFIEEAYKLNKNKSKIQSCYIDFYLKDLNDDDYNKLLEGLDSEDKERLNYIKTISSEKKTFNTEYFEVNDISIITLLTKMCTRELFFITFYFTAIPLTIWGNYNLNFPIFFEDDSVLDKYINIAEACTLNIN